MNNSRSGILRSGYSRVLFLSILLCLIPVTVILGVMLGSADITVSEVFTIIINELSSGEVEDIPKSAVTIIWDLRMPRMLLALAVGGGLAVCGAAMQAITQNILAEPYILGVSSGASAMVALAYYLGLNSLSNVLLANNSVQIFSFFGALISLMLVYSVGSIGKSGGANHLILAGMAVSVMLNALTNFFISIMPSDSAMKNVIGWMWGSLASARWSNILLPIIISIVGLIFFSCFSNSYNLISLGSETAVSFGVNTKLVTKITLFAISLITGVFVSSCGLIGFVGFIIPHMIRLLVGSEHKRLFPFAYLLGAVFLGVMDILSRNIFAPREMAIGIFSAFVGAPFFVFLLFRKSKGVK